MRRGYLFSDIDGSTQRWERAPLAMQLAMRRHDEIFEDLVARHGGIIHDHVGDSVFASFETGDPVACALALQLAFSREVWPLAEGLRVRLGVHASEIEAESAQADASARIAGRIAANRVARIADCAAGGQIVVSLEAVAYGAPAGGEFVALGAVLLKGVDAPVELFGLVHDELDKIPFTRLGHQAPAHANLPAPALPLFGREAELAHLHDLIQAPVHGRIINVVGPAGVGKTRLVQEAALQISKSRPVLYLPLAPLNDGEDLIGVLARALHISPPGESDLAQAIGEALRARPRLLVLDNVERANAEALAHFASFIGAHNHLMAVCVSRWPLAIGQVRMQVRGLSAPKADRAALRDSAAYALFSREAARAGVHLADDHETASLFSQLCTYLGGLPLALQLSAAWLRYLSLEALVERLAHHRGELAFIFADTWAALGAEVRDKLGRLSIFRAAFSADQAAEVAGVELDELMRLDESGLLERAAERSFILHPLLAELAAGEAKGDVLAHAHAENFLSAQMLAPRPRGEGQVPLAELEAAWRFARRHWTLSKLQNAGEHLFYWCAFAGLFKEGALLFAAERSDTGVDAYALALRANCLAHAHQNEAAEQLAQAASASTDALTRAHGLHALGNLAHARGDFDEALAYYESALPLRRALHDRIGVHYTTISMAALALARGDADRAAELLAPAFNDATAHPIAMIHTFYYAGETALARGRLEDAAGNFQRALELDGLVEHPAFRTRLLLRLGALANLEGDHARARALFDDAAQVAKSLGDRRGGLYAAIELGLLVLVAGDAAHAKAELLAATRIGLELRSKPMVARALLALLRVEMAIGDVEAQGRLREVLAGAELGELSAAFAQLTKIEAPPARSSEDGRMLLEEGARRVLQL